LRYSLSKRDDIYFILILFDLLDIWNEILSAPGDVKDVFR